MTTDATHPPKPAKPRKRHWFLRIFVTLAMLLLLIGLAVQIVLWTDLPRGIVVGQLEKQLGLRLTVKSLKTGWLGHTELSDVTISLPLSDKAFLDVPTMKVKNTSLFGLMLGRPVAVQSIELDQPHLYVWEDSAGQWNLQEVAELLALAGGQKTGEASAQASAPAMPDVHLVGGIISVVDNKKRAVDLEPLQVDGYADTAVSWKYDVTIGSHVSMAGKLVPGGFWAHEVAVRIQDIGDWVRPWNANPPILQIDAHWRGQLAQNGVSGRLELQDLTFGNSVGTVQAAGTLKADADSAQVSIHPQNLKLKTSGADGLQLTVTSGLIQLDTASKDLKIDSLLVALFGGVAKIGGSCNLNTSSGRLDAAWDNLALTDEIVHSGNFAITVSQPFPEKFVVEGNLRTAGTQRPRLPGQGGSQLAATATWLVTSAFAATGKSSADFDWKIDIQQAQRQRGVQSISFDGLHLDGGLHNNTLSLAKISLPAMERLEGNAVYHLTGDQPWEAHMKGRRWPVAPVPGMEMGFVLDASGNQDQVTLGKFLLTCPDATLTASGTYARHKPKPLSLRLALTNAATPLLPVPLAARTQAKFVDGKVDAHANIEGTISPLNLDVRGGLDGHDVDIRGHHIGTIAAALSDHCRINSDGIFLSTKSVKLLGGTWNLKTSYDAESNGVNLNLAMDDVSLKQVAAIVGRDQIAGTVSGELSAAVPKLNFDLNRISVTPCTFKFRNVKFQQFAVDELDATLAMGNGHLELSPIHFKQAQGTGEMRIATDLSNFRRIEGHAKLENWPIDIEGAEAHLVASVDVPSVVIQLPNPKSPHPALQKLDAVAKQIDIRATATQKDGKTLGDLSANARFENRALDLRQMHVQLLGGRLDGHAHVRMDEPLASTAEFTWENLDFEKIALLVPQLNEVHGILTGQARLAPASDPRPREPVALVVTSQFKNGAWRTLPIKDLRLAAYIGPNPAEFGGGWRTVMQDSSSTPSFIHMAGGTVELWGRASIHDRGSSSQCEITLSDLDLNQLMHAVAPSSAVVAGRIGGSITVIRAPLPAHQAAPDRSRMFPGPPTVVIEPLPPTDPNEPVLKKLINPVFADGSITISKANLAKIQAFAFLYDAAKLFVNVNKPEGTGEMQFHLERGTLTVEHLRYFNQGTEIRAVAAVNNIWKMPDSPIAATASLTPRPLSAVKLPFLAGFDTALTSIERSLHLTSVRVKGTVDKYKMTQLGLSELGEQMKSLLVSDVKGEAGAGG